MLTLERPTVVLNLPNARIEFTRRVAGFPELRLTGDFGRWAATGLAAVLDDLEKQQIRWMVIDLQAVTYLSHTIIARLVDAADRVRELGGNYILAAVPSCVNGVFQLLGLDTAIRIFAGTREAREFLMNSIVRETTLICEPAALAGLPARTNPKHPIPFFNHTREP